VAAAADRDREVCGRGVRDGFGDPVTERGTRTSDGEWCVVYVERRNR